MKRPLKFSLLAAAGICFAVPAVLVGQSVESSEKNHPVFKGRQVSVSTISDRFIVKHEASLSAVGDILIHDEVYNDAAIHDGYDFDPMFADVKPFLENADITVANSESIIGGSEIGVSSYPSFNSPYEVGDALKNAGVDIVSMANNHTLDRGVRAVENAIRHWDQIGVKHTGSALAAEAATEIPVIVKNGISFAFLSYTYGTNGIPTPAGKEYLVNRIDKAKIEADLSEAKKLSDIVVLSLHFGNEYERMPNETQVDLAHFAAEQGADIILGHHPHVLQPAEWIDTADGRKSFVVYSLGNFLSGQSGTYKKIGGILHIDAEKIICKGKETIRLKDPSFTNTYVTDSNDHNFKVELLKNVDPSLNEETKHHMTTWLPDLQFIE